MRDYTQTERVAVAWRAEQLAELRVEYGRFHRGLAYGFALSACMWAPFLYWWLG